MSRTKDLEERKREKRNEQSGRLLHWAKELEALGQLLWDEDHENGWHVWMVDQPQLTVMVAIGARNGPEFARFVRHEAGITGVFRDDKPQEFTDRLTAFDTAVKRRRATFG